MQERIHTEIRHVYTQLKTFHAEKEVDHNQTRVRNIGWSSFQKLKLCKLQKVWIITAACNLKAELAETLERLRKLQTNFVQVHQSKVFDLERALASNGHHQAGDGHARIDLYRNTSNRLETDMQYNVEISGDLDRLILAVAAAEEVNGGNTGGGGNGYDNHNLDRTYDEVAIHSHIQVPRIVTPTDGGGGGVFASARPEGSYTLETIKRKQNLLIIIGVAIGLATTIGIILTLAL